MSKEPRGPGNPGKTSGVEKVSFDVQANVYEHLKALVRESGIGPHPNAVALYLFTQEVMRSMKDPSLYRLPKEEWLKAPVETSSDA